MKGVGFFSFFSFLFLCLLYVSGEIFHYECFTKVNFSCLLRSSLALFIFFFYPSQFRIYFKANLALGEEEEKSDYKINHHHQQ